ALLADVFGRPLSLPPVVFARADPPASRYVDARSVAFLGRVFHERHETAGHEPAGPDWRAATRDFGHFDDAPGGGDLDPAAGSGGHDVEGLAALAGVDDGFDSISLHPSDNSTGTRGDQRDCGGMGASFDRGGTGSGAAEERRDGRGFAG